MWLYTCLSICSFHSVWSRPLCNCLVKKINQGTDVLTHNCLPPLLAWCVLKGVCTRLIILTGGKNSHKIKIAVASWHSAVDIHPSHCKNTNILIALTACIGREGGVCEKVGSVVKWAGRYHWYYIHYVNQYACGFSSFLAL